MGKRGSGALAALLICALVMPSGNVVRAADAEGQAADASAQFEAKVLEADAPMLFEAEGLAALESVEEVMKESVAKGAVEEAAKEEEEAVGFEVQTLEAQVFEAQALEAQTLESGVGTVLEAVEEGLSGEKELEAKATGTINVTMAVTGGETAERTRLTFGSEDTVGSHRYGYSQQVSLRKGTLGMGVEIHSCNTYGLNYGLFADANMTQEVGYDRYISASGAPGVSDVTYFKVPATGTYYIGIYTDTWSVSDVQVDINVAAVFLNGEDRAITNRQIIVVGQKDAQVNYFTFKAVANGYLTVIGSPEAKYHKVSLCDASKKALTKDMYMIYGSADNPTYIPTYGVQKGKTYLIKVTASSSDGGYILKVLNSAISEKSGKNKSSAVTVKRGKTVKGTIVAGSSQADWYKLQAIGKKMKITVKGLTNDQLRVILYKGGKESERVTWNYYNGGATLESFRAVKGTYYVKIERANAYSSGWYSMSWK